MNVSALSSLRLLPHAEEVGPGQPVAPGLEASELVLRMPSASVALSAPPIAAPPPPATFALASLEAAAERLRSDQNPRVATMMRRVQSLLQLQRAVQDTRRGHVTS